MKRTTTHTETTRTANLNGSTYVRIPPSFIKYLNLQTPENVKIGMAQGKHGKFLWIQKKESEKNV